MENEVWDTDNLKPWQIDKLVEVKRYLEEECETGEVREEERYEAILGILCDLCDTGKVTVKQLRALNGKRIKAFGSGQATFRSTCRR
jgi:hypothetical protein